MQNLKLSKSFTEAPAKNRELENMLILSGVLWSIMIFGIIAILTIAALTGAFATVFTSVLPITFCFILFLAFGVAAMMNDHDYSERLAYLNRFTKQVEMLKAFSKHRYGLVLPKKALYSLLLDKPTTVNIDGTHRKIKLSLLADNTEARLLDNQSKDELLIKLNINL